MQKILDKTIAVGSLIGNYQFVEKDFHSPNTQRLHNFGVIFFMRISRRKVESCCDQTFPLE